LAVARTFLARAVYARCTIATFVYASIAVLVEAGGVTEFLAGFDGRRP
jgi:hypothetical protein